VCVFQRQGCCDACGGSLTAHEALLFSICGLQHPASRHPRLDVSCFHMPPPLPAPPPRFHMPPPLPAPPPPRPSPSPAQPILWRSMPSLRLPCRSWAPCLASWSRWEHWGPSPLISGEPFTGDTLLGMPFVGDVCVGMSVGWSSSQSCQGCIICFRPQVGFWQGMCAVGRTCGCADVRQGWVSISLPMPTLSSMAPCRLTSRRAGPTLPHPAHRPVLLQPGPWAGLLYWRHL
jgi:hypothetical protein